MRTRKPSSRPCLSRSVCLAFLVCIVLCSGCSSAPGLAREASPRAPSAMGESAIAREFRGAWVASFMNIDWPPRPGLGASELQASVDATLDKARELRLNAIILQVRPCGDSLYRSSIEPWSSYLTGRQGQEPDGGFDPLEAFIESARAHGIRLYAWINPFRVGAPSIASYAASSPLQARPELVRRLGENGYAWLDPGLPQARAYVLEVLGDLILRYDLDGLFIDDYFYPSGPHLGGLPDFPDEESYQAYRGSGGILGKAEWRRRNTDSFVRELKALLGELKPGLPLGISPAGIWRPDNPPGIRGRDAYADSYTDTRSWAENGIADIFSPQLYWPIAQVPQSFPLLLRFWIDENSNRRMLWPSLFAGIESVEAQSRARELSSQIMVERGMNPGDSGFILYGWNRLSDPNGPFFPALLAGPLVEPALHPAFPWLPGTAPPLRSFTAQRREGSVLIEWDAPGAREMLLHAEGDGGRSEHFILAPKGPDFEFKWPEGEYLKLSLRAIGLSGSESPVLSLECLEYHEVETGGSGG